MASFRLTNLLICVLFWLFINIIIIIIIWSQNTPLIHDKPPKIHYSYIPWCVCCDAFFLHSPLIRRHEIVNYSSLDSFKTVTFCYLDIYIYTICIRRSSLWYRCGTRSTLPEHIPKLVSSSSPAGCAVMATQFSIVPVQFPSALSVSLSLSKTCIPYASIILLLHTHKLWNTFRNPPIRCTCSCSGVTATRCVYIV